MPQIDVNTIMQWQALITSAATLGVKSWQSIHALMQDAGLDDATIAALKGKWDTLVSDIARAAAHSQVGGVGGGFTST